MRASATMGASRSLLYVFRGGPWSSGFSAVGDSWWDVRRFLVYGLAAMSPSLPGRAFVASYGVTKRLSDRHVRNAERPAPDCGGRAVPWRRVRGQNLGVGAWDSTISAASSFVSTEGGEPDSGFLAVSFMQATAMTPTTAAAME